MHDRQLSGAYYERPCLLPELSFADRKLRILIQQSYPLYLIMLEGHMAAKRGMWDADKAVAQMLETLAL